VFKEGIDVVFKEGLSSCLKREHLEKFCLRRV